MMEIYKPTEMDYVAVGGRNYGDDPDDAAHYTYERNVYLQLTLNFAYPKTDNSLVEGMRVSRIVKRIIQFGSVDLHETNVNIVRQVSAKYPECKTMIRNYEDLDLNPYVDEASADMKS